MRQINQPVEIAQVDSVGSAAGEELGAGIGRAYEFDAEFHGLQSTAVEHPLLAATVAHLQDRPYICLGVRMIGERRSDAGDDVESLEVLAFGGVIIDTQGSPWGLKCMPLCSCLVCSGHAVQRVTCERCARVRADV